MVGLALLRTVASTSSAAGPSFSSRLSTSARSVSMPWRAASSVRAARTVGVSRNGHSCSPMRVTAAASRVTAFSLLTLEPCPARPRAVSFSQAVPRSPAAMG